LRARLEGLETGHEETEGIGQPTDHVKRETDRERILDLLARSAGSEDCSYVTPASTVSWRVSLPSIISVARNGSSMAAASRYVFSVAIGRLRDGNVRLYTELALVGHRDAAINSRSPTDQAEGPRIACWVTFDIGSP
jgi:hypothetical protein